jgi:hypothetical protein
VDSWLLFKLTAHRRHVTDATNASRTLLYNLRDGGWDERLLELLQVPRACLPEIVDTCLARADALEIDIDGTKLPLCGIAGDQQAALFGQGCFSPGMAKNTYGTGCFRAHEHRRHSQAFAPPTADDGGACGAAPASTRSRAAYSWVAPPVQWLRDGLGIIERSADVEALAASVTRYRRCLPGAGLRGPGCAQVGCRGPRHHRWPDARFDARPPGARRARKHRLPDRRSHRDHAAGLRDTRSRNCASTAARRATICCCRCRLTCWAYPC